MTHLSGQARAKYVQGMFARIASRYDLMNRLMTFGQDRYWRREVIQRAKLLQTGGYVLDLGAGTGDLGIEVVNQQPTIIPVEVDFTIEMMRVGQARPEAETLRWTAADALNLPFPDNAFDAVISGFLLRNVIDLPQALREQYRVIKPGGHIVTLDTTRPKKSPLTPLVRFHMHAVIPALGRLISGQDDAYVYLPESSEEFVSAEELVAHMAAAGFVEIAYRRMSFGTIAIHWGRKLAMR